MLLDSIDITLPAHPNAVGDSKASSLPTQIWPRNKRGIGEAVRKAAAQAPWQWPAKTQFFLSDPHADADAFEDSLIMSGSVYRTPNHALALTEAGRSGVFIIGGDCLDKGPSNLKLLKSIRRLMNLGARVELLAGNHDARLLMGLKALSPAADVRSSHMFVRMGAKVIPLLVEVYQQYAEAICALEAPSAKQCRKELFPSEDWFRQFPKQAKGLMSAEAVDKEMDRIQRKLDTFEDQCKSAGLSIRQVYATAHCCRALFLSSWGEFAWFYQNMKLLHREGAFLFLHAGLDDAMAQMLEQYSIDEINALYRDQVDASLFEFYYGSLANSMRTKYRSVDKPLTSGGVRRLNRMGIHAVVHGHRNRTNGQRIALRKGLIHIEGDITLDRNSRRKEGMKGSGMGATIIRPEGCVIGLSSDYPYAKLFEPNRYLLC